MSERSGIAQHWAAALVLPAVGMIPAACVEDAGPGVSAIDVAQGDRLAHTRCVNCHIVDSHGPLVRTDRVPSFPWIARQPGLTQEFLTAWLSTSASHERMPAPSLTREEIRQLSAYIISLKGP